MIHIQTTAEVVKVLGGNPAVAVLTSSTPKAVSNWKRFETFPSNTYVAMIRALRERGYDAPDSLWGMKSPEEAVPEAIPEGAS